MSLATIKLDIDNGRPPRFAELARRLRVAGYRARWVSYVRSPSGAGWHVALSVTPLPPNEMAVVALQLLLGSDPRRESYNLMRVRQIQAGHIPSFCRRHRSPSCDCWNVFYRKID